MIASLTGRLVLKTPTHVTLDVHGVGYEVFIPLSTFYALSDSEDPVSLRILTHVREDAIQLFGFLTSQEKDAFVLLTSVSGIGPKLALSVLSALSVADLAGAVQVGDLDKLATVSGIGKKSAARLVLELKDKVAKLSLSVGGVTVVESSGSSRLQEDALSALVNLGYRPADVKDIVKRLLPTEGETRSLKDMIREALKELAKS
jgi:Holliday junction DNA helicase RuvA